MRQRRRARGDRRRRTSRPSSGSSTSRSTSPPRLLEGRVFSELERDARASLNDAEGRARTVGAHMMMIGILPTIDPTSTCTPSRSARNPRYALLNEQIFAARGEDLRDLDRRASSGCRPTPTRSRPRPRARACSCTCRSSPQAFAALLERGAGDRRRAARGRRELAVLLRQGAVARDPHRAVRAGHRHPPGGAEGPGRAAAGVVRRALDHVDLRPVRGERRYFPALLPVCDDEDPLEMLERGDVPRLASCGCTTARSTAGTARSTTSSADQPHLRVENRVLPAGPTVVDILANAAFYYGLLRVLADAGAAGVVADVVRGRRGELPRRRPRRHRRAPVLARVGRGARRPSSCSGGCCRWRTRAWTRWGVDSADAIGCSGSSSAAAWRCATAPRGRAQRLPPLRRGQAALDRRDALRRDDCAATASTCTPTSRSTTGPSD